MTRLATPFPDISRQGQIPDGPFVFEDDFVLGGYCPDLALSNESDPAAKFSEVADRGEWLVTRDAAPTIVIGDGMPGGVLVVTTGSSAGDFVSLQLNGAAFVPAAGRRIRFWVRLKLDDADDAMWFAGLAGPDVTGSTRGPIADGTTNSIGFRNVAGNTANIHYVVEDNTVETTADSGIDLADDTFVWLGFEIDGVDEIRLFVETASLREATKVATVKTNIPAGDALTPTLEVSATTASSVLLVDKIVAISDR